MSSLKIIAVNSSPKREKGNTVKILNSFLEGAKEAGAETHLEHIYGQEINPCSACYSCWFKTQGECAQKDDMKKIFNKVKESDILVFCTPLYFYGVSGVMKNFIDRLLPLGTPYVEIKDDYVRKSVRDGIKILKMVVVSSCGLPGLNQFDAMGNYFVNLEKYSGIEFSGALLRPNFRGASTHSEIYSASKKAGAQLVEEGTISSKVLDIISTPFTTNEEFVETTNKRKV